ncbi:MAG TPA: hypothetical protein VKA46_24295 [Gemmataceae bacterium]|nr:hypothetical protein [Gemmataceae bacterium]
MSVRDLPHYSLSAATLADWVENQPERWWFVDGDPVLTGEVYFPCPSDELASLLRKVGGRLLLYDKTPGSHARGEEVGADRLDDLCDTTDNFQQKTLVLCWDNADIDWLLVEDKEAARVGA